MLKQPISTVPSVIVGAFVGFVFFFGGYLLCVGEHDTYGTVMFLLVPFVSGFSIAAVVKRSSLVLACCIMVAILVLSMLIAIGLEGYICCLMALPLIALGMAIGASTGYFVNGRVLNQTASPKKNTVMLILACPLLVAAANSAEKPLRGIQRIETFSTDITVSATPDTTWAHLVRMAPMSGTKPFLLRVGLPVPFRCTLEKESVGAERVCYFDQGVIEQQVTEWREPNEIKVKITRSTLPGRRWLTFNDASYKLIPLGTGTKVVRRTTIASSLYPRWYWRPFEEWGVTSEDNYVLSSLKVSVENP